MTPTATSSRARRQPRGPRAVRRTAGPSTPGIRPDPLFDAPKLLDLDKVIRSSINPRRRFNEGALNELASNIRRHGVLQPILYRPKKVGDDEFFEIVAGERRWRASRIAEQPQVPAIVREMTDTEALGSQSSRTPSAKTCTPSRRPRASVPCSRPMGTARRPASQLMTWRPRSAEPHPHLQPAQAAAADPRPARRLLQDDFNATVAQQLARLPAKDAAQGLRSAAQGHGRRRAHQRAGISQTAARQFHLRMDRATFPSSRMRACWRVHPRAHSAPR